MTGYRAALLNFSKGEISPEVRARFDLGAYQSAAERAYNVKIRRTGGLYKRAGTRYVADALSSTSKLVPFQFNDEQAYMHELSQSKMRPAALGGVLLETGLAVTAITKAANAKITSSWHGYNPGDVIYLDSILGMVEINNRFLTIVSVIDDNNFTVNFDSTNASTFTGDTGGQVNTGPPAPPPDPLPTPPPITPPGGPGNGSGSGGGYNGGGAGPTDLSPVIQPWNALGVHPVLP